MAQNRSLSQGEQVEATVESVTDYGVWLSTQSKRLLMLAPDAGLPRGSQLRDAFKNGDSLVVEVILFAEETSTYRVRIPPKRSR